jgi:hypothetical protein
MYLLSLISSSLLLDLEQAKNSGISFNYFSWVAGPEAVQLPFWLFGNKTGLYKLKYTSNTFYTTDYTLHNTNNDTTTHTIAKHIVLAPKKLHRPNTSFQSPPLHLIIHDITRSQALSVLLLSSFPNPSQNA